MAAAKARLNSEIDALLYDAEIFRDNANRMAYSNPSGHAFGSIKGWQHRKNGRSEPMFGFGTPGRFETYSGILDKDLKRTLEQVGPLCDETAQRFEFGRRLRKGDQDWDSTIPDQPQPTGREYIRYPAPDFKALNELVATIRDTDFFEHGKSLVVYLEHLLNQVQRESATLIHYANQVAINNDISFHFEHQDLSAAEPQHESLNNVLNIITLADVDAQSTTAVDALLRSDKRQRRR